MMKTLISFQILQVEKAAVRFNGTAKELGQWGGGDGEGDNDKILMIQLDGDAKHPRKQYFPPL